MNSCFVSTASFKHEILYDWINPTYLDMDYQVQIQEEFEERSEILLKEFLKVRQHILSSVSWGHPVAARMKSHCYNNCFCQSCFLGG